MGLWHQRKIDTLNSLVAKESLLPSSFFTNIVHFFCSGEIALTSAPYASYVSHHQHLYHKNSIYIAIDGLVRHTDNIPVKIEELATMYQKSSIEWLHKLKGTFSLILYDADKKLTLLFRSFLTGNPLYYVAKNNLLSVSTNPVNLFHRADVSDALKADKMNALFSLSYHEFSENLFSDLMYVDRGEIVVITSDTIRHIKQPLDKVFSVQNYGNETEVRDTYRTMVEERVQESLFPNIKHGIMLSSGMDSSTIAVFAAQKMQRENRSLTAYSWTLPNDPTGDESENIKALCRELHIPLKLFNGEAFGPFDVFGSRLLVPDTPYTNQYWPVTAEAYHLAAKDGIEVMLNGAYGDMLFFGRSTVLADILRDGRFDLLLPELYAFAKKKGYRKAMKYSSEIRGLIKMILPEVLIPLLRNSKRDTNAVTLPEWLSDEAREYHHSKQLAAKASAGLDGFEKLAVALNPYQASYLGFERYLSGQYGIKRIDPLNNLDLLNYTSGIPAYMTYRKGQTKYFAREAMRELLPRSIHQQPRVGSLTRFSYTSYERNKVKVRQRLLDDRTVWKKYIDETWMERKLNSNSDSLNSNDLTLMRLSLNMQQWQKAIKPGGSLYEGKFNSIK